MLLRHEIGHCIEHAYQLSKTAKWRNVFGDPSVEYNPDNYSWNPLSEDYVKHLPDGYAQAHPEEDFAETFAVWVKDPKKAFKDYSHLPKVLAKFRYLEKEIESLKDVARSLPVRRFFLLSVIAVGIYGALSARILVLFVQVVPALVSLVLVTLAARNEQKNAR